ncbi:hypothetical protein PMZ80_002613 [Knufia obscura]|uniref:Uncharacterized protein n=1 Tax=Knufia obscura TaxID=1635080 RepID=A0ABR0RYY4_9EURO|nr:hypothetical protein PMZ80_002613 [Knufia obscura]
MADAIADQSSAYGPTTISDHAHVVVGNKYNGLGDTYQINQATIFVTESPQYAYHTTSRGVKRRYADVAAEDDRDFQPYSLADETEDPAKACIGYKNKKVKLLNNGCRFCQRVLNAVTVPQRTSASAPQISSTVADDDYEMADAQLVSNDETSHAHTDTRRPFTERSRKLIELAVPAAMVSFLACRSTNIEAILNLARQLREDALFPVTTAILASWLTAILSRSTISRSISELTSDCVWLEDVYRTRRKLPLAYFAYEETLQAFFSAHYKGSTAETLVADGQFNLMLKTRNGQPRSLAELCTSKIPIDSSLFMAVLYRVGSPNCLECLNKLKFCKSGSYACTYRRREYRIRYNHNAVPKKPNTAIFLLPSSRTPDLVALTTGLGGFLNVDLGMRRRVCPKRKANNLPVLSALGAHSPHHHWQSAPMRTSYQSAACQVSVRLEPCTFTESGPFSPILIDDKAISSPTLVKPEWHNPDDLRHDQSFEHAAPPPITRHQQYYQQQHASSYLPQQSIRFPMFEDIAHGSQNMLGQPSFGTMWNRYDSNYAGPFLNSYAVDSTLRPFDAMSSISGGNFVNHMRTTQHYSEPLPRHYTTPDNYAQTRHPPDRRPPSEFNGQLSRVSLRYDSSYVNFQQRPLSMFSGHV